MALLLVLFFYAGTTGAGQSHKPLPPLRISIVPVQSGLTPDHIKPGDAVELKVTAVSAIDAPELHINVELIGGAKLVSGDTSWSGQAAKNEEKSFILTVQTPKTGKGKVRARVFISPSDGGPRFSAVAQYVLGPAIKTKPEQDHAVKKDKKGRSIVEYR